MPKSPSTSTTKETVHPSGRKCPPEWTPQVGGTFARIPTDVLSGDLPPFAKLVFCAVGMEARKQGTVRISLRRLSALTGIRKSHVGNALIVLASAGLLEPQKAVRGKCKTYRLLHSLWGYEMPKPQAQCPRCHARAFALGVSGVCGKCLNVLRKSMKSQAVA